MVRTEEQENSSEHDTNRLHLPFFCSSALTIFSASFVVNN